MEQNERYKIINGDSLEILDTLDDNSIDAIITDPPYELGFMGKKWDKTGIAYNVELWKKAYRVLKSGGHLLAFGGSRTFHRIACAIEDAGFEIRDTIMWLYGSGFPKSLNIGLAIDKKNGVDNRTGTIKSDGKATQGDIYNWRECEDTRQYEERKATNEWSGWGTALKPAYEPIIVARKPVEKSVVDNVLKYGTGGINIDECRVPTEQGELTPRNNKKGQNGIFNASGGLVVPSELGRFPANVILTYDDTDFEEVCGNMPYSKSTDNIRHNNNDNKEYNCYSNYGNCDTSGYDDSGNACRYFYCAKASTKDRDNGLDLLETTQISDGSIRSNSDTARKIGANPVKKKNIHPTVKPCELMQYLVRLITQRGGVVLDIFNGSGSTGKAVAFENRERNMDYKYIGIELDAEYCMISEMRIDYAINKYEYDMIQDIKREEQETGQLSLFDF